MLANVKENGKVIDVSSLRQQPEIEDDFNSLIPQASIPVEAIEDIAEMEHNRREQVGKDALPEETFNQVLESCFKTGGYRGLRDATYLILQSNWGVRIGDCLEVKRFDFIDQNGQFREKCLFHEQKTGKPRTMYINDTIKMCILMLLWTGKFNDPRSHLLVSDSPNKGYVKLRDENGKVKRVNGKYVYATDADGNKIIEPVKYDAMAKMLQKRLVDDLGIELKNITREVPDDKKIQSQMKLAIATHSLRKLYSEKVEQQFQQMYGEASASHSAAMTFLNWDLNHSSVAITSRYCGDFERTKKAINMNMKLGYSVVKKYFELEKAKHINK